MTFPCIPARLTPSVALLLGLAGSLAGCVDPKSIGLETAEDGSGSVESGSEGEGSEGTGGTSQGQTTAQTDGPDTDPTGETGEAFCPPIDIPACAICECIEGEWSCDESACASSCEGQACGAGCLLCPADDPDCENPTPDGLCTADGLCVGTPPPKLGFCEGALQPGFEDELTVGFGCIDMNVGLRDDADERAIMMSFSGGLVAQAWAAGEPLHVELSATDPTVSIEGRAGFSVTSEDCTDLFGNPDIKETWRPSSGTVIVDITSISAELADATVELVDVELHRVQPGPAPIVVNVTIPDVSVGWTPG